MEKRSYCENSKKKKTFFFFGGGGGVGSEGRIGGGDVRVDGNGELQLL